MMNSHPVLLLLSWSWLLLSLLPCDANSLPGVPMDCEAARAKCAFRGSCYVALHSYMIDCADVLAGRTSRCPWACKRALISLTSTDVGLALSTCECSDDFCLRSKERVEVCRPEVAHATAENTIVSCSVAKWICAADTLCSTALEYYHRLCRPMFHGRKCTPRCNNSLAILDRQVKAKKLRDCFCEGTEDFPCKTIKQNTQKLCYGREGWVSNDHLYRPSTTVVPGSGSSDHGPCGLPWYLVWSALLVMVFLRTSVCFSNKWIDKTNEMNSEPSSELPSLEEKNWPWWWTSEVQLTRSLI